jgi:diguanylate cyclase (GGDEF)-like protein
MLAQQRHGKRLRRVRTLCVLSTGALAASLVTAWAFATPIVLAVLALSILGCAFSAVRAWQGHDQQAVVLMLSTLFVGLSMVMWTNMGLRDPSMSAYPGVLLFAALLGERRLFRVLMVAMLANVLAVGAAELMGWVSFAVKPMNVSIVTDHLTLLAITGLAARWLWLDQNNALTLMEAEARRAQEHADQVRFLSHHDPLTGLPNRALGQERFERAAAAARRQGQQVALLYFDLDHFKLVNDSLGHPAGDALLQAVAQRVQPLIRDTDTLCRFGGDEFLILLTGLDRGERASRVAEEVVAALSHPFMLMDRNVNCGCSMGVVLCPADGDQFDALLQRADLAMYKAKESGRSAFHFYDDRLQATVEEQLVLDAALREALEQPDQLRLAYQPQFDLQTGRLAGFEALLRWKHPRLGDVSPARFIPQAERNGLIVPLGLWVLRTACQQVQAWRAAGMPAQLRVSVNVSPVQLRRPGFAEQVRDALKEAALQPGALELELTESMLMDELGDAPRTLNTLVDMGVELAIDDFGTGYSNLGYLRRFHVGRLKIDRSFVSRLGGTAHDEAIVRAVVQMAQGLGLRTVAEGVETEAQREHLQRLGCDQAQGFLWHPALAPAVCEGLWRDAAPVAPDALGAPQPA